MDSTDAAMADAADNIIKHRNDLDRLQATITQVVDLEIRGWRLESHNKLPDSQVWTLTRKRWWERNRKVKAIRYYYEERL